VTAAPQLAEELFNEHSRRIYAYCLRQLGSPEEAEDAVQATYLNACRSLMSGFEPDAAQAWLFKVAHNVCLTKQRSSYRRARVERPHDLQAVQDVVAAPEISGDELFGLDEALAGLPEQQRNAILLREWQGLSYKEVATKLGLTQAAVETLIFRARRSLASALDEPVKRRRLAHSFDAGALLASLKSVVAGNLSASVGAAVAVAASVTAMTAAPAIRGVDFPTHVFPAAQVETVKPATRAKLADRVRTPVAAAPAAEPSADTRLRVDGPAEHGNAREARGRHRPQNGHHGPKAQADHHHPFAPHQPHVKASPPKSHATIAPPAASKKSSPPAYGRGGKKG
jgi:RNA polymerase sigma-70 factor (ECF subfamily)